MKYILTLIVGISLLSCTIEMSQQEKETYLKNGKEIGQTVVKKLGSSLMKQMKSGGPKQAIPFCNTAALPFTKEIVTKYNVAIKRTSHRLRNGKNRPNTDEKRVLDSYLLSLSEGKSLMPMIKKEADGKVHFYAPIKVENKCLACHGSVGKEVKKETYNLIKSLYPNDKATGFKAGDLRGVMSITFYEK